MSAASRGVVLSAKDVTVRFGGLTAVSQVSVEVTEGEIFGIIGPNGAGKTTFFNLLTAIYTPTEGKINVLGTQLEGLKPYEICKLGVARTFQNIRLFKDLSVLDNVRIALHAKADHKPGLFTTFIRGPKQRKHEEKLESDAMELLKLFGLAERAENQSRSLPYGDQRKLEIARAIATGARILLLDEPAAGLNPQEKRELAALIRRVRQEFSATVMLIEHDMRLVMDVCERICVLDHGVKIAEGTPKQIQNDPKVLEAYLGKKEAAHAGA